LGLEVRHAAREHFVRCAVERRADPDHGAGRLGPRDC
jgi:hypothetical protein